MATINPEDFRNTILKTDALPKFEEVPLEKLAKKYLVKLNISTALFFLILIVLASLAYYYFSEFEKYFPFVLGFLLAVSFWSFYTNYQLQKRNGYGIRERDVIYRRGFLFEKNTVIPFNRVQHVSVNRGILDKNLNLSTLKIFTAGGSGSDISIPGILPEKAAALKEALANRMAKHV